MNRFPETHFNSIGPWLKEYFGCRVIKLSLDGGFTCPNRDGRCGYGGCSFCSDNGSGTYASPFSPADIASAMEPQINAQKHKWPDAKYIAYFQSHTNTYAPVEKLRALWDAALSYEGVVGLAIATRPDCLGEDVLELLDEYNRKTFLWVELGLQTSNEKTAAGFNRCYDNKVFDEAIKALSDRGIKTVVHLILGLPGEDRADFLRSAEYVSSFNPFGIKLHMLHLMKGTRMAEELGFETENIAESPSAINSESKLLSMEQYVDIVCDILEGLPDTITIHRLTGDAPGNELLAPEWTRNKHAVLNAIQHEFSIRGSYQGSHFQ